jgi:hypothetical protein
MYRWPMTRATLLFFWGESERKKLIHERASEDCFPPQGEAFALFELSTTSIMTVLLDDCHLLMLSIWYLQHMVMNKTKMNEHIFWLKCVGRSVYSIMGTQPESAERHEEELNCALRGITNHI